MHIADLDKGMLGANGIVGGGPPLVCGVGLSAKVAGPTRSRVSFTGDGGSNQGTFLESLNLAGRLEAPVHVRRREQRLCGGDVVALPPARSRRCEAGRRLRHSGRVVDGHDYFAVREVAGEAVAAPAKAAARR